MKVLSIKNPWANLIIDGYKGYEFRSWKTNYRGKILIHSSVGYSREEMNLFKDYNLDYVFGAIIGEAYIEDCVLVSDDLMNKLRNKDSLVYSRCDKYGFKLTNIVKYDKPIYCKGKLGLWNYDY